VNEHFADRLIAELERKRCYLAVGLDPDLSHMPPEMLDGVTDFASAGRAAEKFCTAIIDGVSDIVAVVKPQSAFFEQFGSDGMAALERVIDHARNAGLLVLEDAKRGDIGSTMAAYSAAILGRVEIGGRPVPVQDVDAVTVSPYLGPESLAPMLAAADAWGKGVFVLVRTSNPGSGQLQMLETNRGRLFETVAESVDELGATRLGERGYSNVGAVTGLTYPEDAPLLRTAMPRAFFLVPGLGAQGGQPRDFPLFLNDDGLGAIVASSRAIASGWSQNGTVPGSILKQVREGAELAARRSGLALQQALVGADRWLW